MAASTGKTVGLILLIILIIFLGIRLTPLILAPLGIVSGTWHMLKIPGADEIQIGPGLRHISALSIFSLALLVLWIIVIVWVYRDAERRGMNGVLWALLVLIGNLIGLLIYLIVRTDNLPAVKESEKNQDCPACQQAVPAHYAFCPHCGVKLQPGCPGCGKTVEKTWKACPHCGEKLPDS